MLLNTQHNPIFDSKSASHVSVPIPQPRPWLTATDPSIISLADLRDRIPDLVKDTGGNYRYVTNDPER